MSADSTRQPLSDPPVAPDAESRRGLLILIAVAGSIISLAVVMLAGGPYWRTNSGVTNAVLIALVIGTTIGLAQAPVVAWALLRARLTAAVPLVYLLATIAAGMLMRLHEPVLAVFAFIFAVPVLAILARLLPARPVASPDRCYACRYDLSRGHSGICPECGAPQFTPMAPAPGEDNA